MDRRPSDPSPLIGTDGLARLMPMHLILSESGQIKAAGPTLEKVLAGIDLCGRRFLEVFRILRPRTVTRMADLLSLAGQGIVVGLRTGGGRPLRGHLLRMEQGGALLNLSFGISAAEAVRDHGLSHADFAPTDLTIELLYLTEAKMAVMAELKALNERLRAAQQRAEAQALTDPLTGLANRRAFDQALTQAIAAAERGRVFTLLHLDLDRFKQINDSLGHAAGDHVLARVATILSDNTRRSDLIARIGGDEFMVILHGTCEPDVLAGISMRIIASLERPVDYQGTACPISGSIGMARSTSYEQPEGRRMLQDADAALYRAKREGRGRVRIFDPKAEAAA